MNKIYAGIGSRETPDNILLLMTKIASTLETMGYILRSGGAIGADTAFANGVLNDANKDIIYPHEATPQGIELASRLHPNWGACTGDTPMKHGRNSMIVLGRDLTVHSNFVICWTEGGLLKGGTAMGIRIANYYKIPVFNLADLKNLKSLNFRLQTAFNI